MGYIVDVLLDFGSSECSFSKTGGYNYCTLEGTLKNQSVMILKMCSFLSNNFIFRNKKYGELLFL